MGSVAVLVPAAARLSPVAACGDELGLREHRPPARLAKAQLVKRLRDLEAHVDADEIGKLERPHAKSALEPADPVDRLHVRDALADELERLEAERAVAAVDDEPGPVGRRDHPPAHRLARPPSPPRSPSPSPAARPAPSASSEDSRPEIPSTSRMSGAGLKKCIPTTR